MSLSILLDVGGGCYGKWDVGSSASDVDCDKPTLGERPLGRRTRVDRRPHQSQHVYASIWATFPSCRLFAPLIHCG